MNVLIYILLPIHNRKETTRQFIQCLKIQTNQHFKLIVIDDGSDDGSFEMIRESIPEAVQIRGEGKWWWGGSLQQGYQWLKKNVTGKEFLLIINDDSIIESDFLQTGIDILKENSKTLLLAEAYSMQTKKLIDKGVFFDFKNFKIHMAQSNEEINCMSTRGLFLRVSDLIELRGIKSNLLPHYYSDYEFTIRAGRKGYKLMVSDTLKLWMNETSTGIGLIADRSPGAYLKKYFSKKHTDHPVYTFNFIMLTFPFPFNIKYGIRHIIRTSKTLVKLLMREKAS